MFDDLHPKRYFPAAQDLFDQPTEGVPADRFPGDACAVESDADLIVRVYPDDEVWEYDRHHEIPTGFARRCTVAAGAA
ncbi:hypothetical protein GCM10027064_24820 [Microbacterium petrolearium]